MSRFIDFTDGWTESDPNNRLTVTASQVTFAGLQPNDNNTYCSYDSNGSFFGTHLCHSFECRIERPIPNNEAIIHLWTLGERLGDMDDMGIDNVPTLYAYKTGGNLSLRLRKYPGGAGDSYNISIGTTYYVDIIRNNTSIKAYIYSDEDRKTLLETLSETILSKEYRYLLVTQSWNVGLVNAPISGYVRNLKAKTKGCNYFTIFGETKAVDLNLPNNIGWVNSRGIQQFHFWRGSDAVSDIGKDAETVTITGFEKSGVSDTFRVLDEIVNDGDEITLAGFDNPDLDTTWVISDYNYTVNGGMDDECEYSITLEKT